MQSKVKNAINFALQNFTPMSANIMSRQVRQADLKSNSSELNEANKTEKTQVKPTANYLAENQLNFSIKKYFIKFN